MTDIGKDSRNASRGAPIHKEQPKVTNRIANSIGSNRQTGDRDQVLHHHPPCAVLGLIRQPGEEEARNGLSNPVKQDKRQGVKNRYMGNTTHSPNTWGSGQKKRLGGRESHSLEDDSDEEGDGVCWHSGGQKHQP